ncbi:plexin domain-containing protein 2-like [Uloborus diversus]|uniref:plexin domain-containing protein 2-like n=1 Tax=Uloborus diversus TaxID=327109 RepID=UPI00240A6299|nr:plexin domain-containing protein 2-like [Uloborus diversus]
MCRESDGLSPPTDVWSKLSDSKRKLSRTELSSEVMGTSAGHSDLYRTEPLSELGITVPPQDANYTLEEDFHTYYNSTFYSDKDKASAFWVDLDSLPRHQVITHEMLSDSHRQATTIEMSFDFPFYGTPVRNVTVATGGFLYTGDYLHNWIAATQYVAPLMANFDTASSPESTIKYVDNGTAFTVQWTKVSLQDKANDGAFTFQVTLLKNGDIVFAYKDVPYPVVNISDARHPVKVGISDAYILERNIFFLRRKTIYEYHRIDMMKREISNDTAIYFVALPTCAGKRECLSCLAPDPRLRCEWCDAVGRCSDGMDRLRQEWLEKRCSLQKEASCAANARELYASESFSLCFEFIQMESSLLGRLPNYMQSVVKHYMGKSPMEGATDSTTMNSATSMQSIPGATDAVAAPEHAREESAHIIQVIENGVSTGAIVCIVVFLAISVSVAVWVFYAFRNPETPSGQFLIKYRPSQWTFRKEEGGITSNSRHL